ncbi:MAG TPA: sigma-54 dependent transcriptional regulator [Longimicrobiales bacterium]|nr:sigma-54 dependent transcriptional regulator [Longimicrobiales bacterium]
MANILCVDDEPAALLVLKETLERAGHRTVCVHNVEAAFAVLARGGVDLIISDYRMPGSTGLEFLSRLGREGFDIPLVMTTGYASIEHAVAAIKAGAVDYVTKPVRPAQLELVVEQALEFVRLRRENAALREEVSQLRNERKVLGESRALKRVLDTVATVAPTRATVLLQGESGTGKELIARTIHQLSDRSDGPFISVNCAAMPETLVESLLFGHEKGAFTGALKQVKGAFERANRGTLLLDEISEMRLDLQAKLLRVLQEQEFERVGGSAPIRVDVRIVATTNRDLAAEVKEGRFREDLFYRLTVVPIRIPPLRERMEDIPVLVQAFAARTAREIGKPLDGVAPETVALLQRSSWPGNVRELAHAVERAVILSTDSTLRPQAFAGQPFGLAAGASGSAAVDAGAIDSPGRDDPAAGAAGELQIRLRSLNIAEAEATLIEHALRVTNQNRTRAADLLGISVRTLRNKLNRPEGEVDAE